MTQIITATIDQEAFRKDVMALLEGAPIQKLLDGGILPIGAWSWKLLPKLWEVTKAVIASVEVVKTNAIRLQDPDGSKGLKFDSHLALETAVQCLDDLVVFTGPVGGWVEEHDRDALVWIIEKALTGFRGVNWFETARAILGLL